MDYTDPADRRLRDEPTLPLSPEEAQIAAGLYSASAYGQFVNWLNNSNPSLPNHEKENPQAHN